MTKISCTECRERLGEVLADEVAPVHASSPNSAAPNGSLADAALLRAHLADCKECARDLKVLRSAHEALKSFEPVTPPEDLRSRIRAQVEREPSPQAVEVGVGGTFSDSNHVAPTQGRMDVVPPVMRLPRVARQQSRDVRDSWDKFKRFFRRPTNVAWASGLALATFCLVLVVRPGSETSRIVPSPQPASSVAERNEETIVSQKANPANKGANNKVNTAKPAATPPAPLSPALPGIAPIPTLPPQENIFPMPDDPSTGAPLTSTPSQPPERNNDSAGNGAREQAPAALPPPAASTPARAPAAASNAAAPSSAEPSAAQTRRAEAPAGNRSAGGFAAATESSNSIAGPPGPAGLPAPAAKPSAPAAKRARSMESPSDALLDEAKENTPVSRYVSARITPSRDINWGQISVVLSGDASFESGNRAKVIWRGSASAGEPIEVGFSVSGRPGRHSARLILQEVKKGDAQTVTSKSVPVNLR